MIGKEINLLSENFFDKGSAPDKMFEVAKVPTNEIKGLVFDLVARNTIYHGIGIGIDDAKKVRKIYYDSDMNKYTHSIDYDENGLVAHKI